ncbi:MAG TPA: DUF5694 domain-containing protein [Thermoanaerobaculia bacterium]|nr:DUF5694 domain-containing protein [Thermoanaerobaculia bacterium]
MRIALLVLALLLLAPAANAADETEVLFVGTFHFENPGLDYVKSEVPDVLTPERQKEIATLVANLARFKPTKVMIEMPASQAEAVQKQYAAYLAGQRNEKERSEHYQLGFRLAALRGLTSIHAIDVRGDLDLGAVMAHAEKHDPRFMGIFGRFMAEVLEPQKKMQVERPLRETLRAINDPRRLWHDHEMYVELARVGTATNLIGAEQTAAWYTRNIRIFAHLARVAEAGDRIVVIYGAGHVPILQQLVRDMPGMSVVNANDYL